MEDLKQKLVNKYKEDTAEKVNIDKKISEMKRIIESLKKAVADVEKDMKNNSVNNENAKESNCLGLLFRSSIILSPQFHVHNLCEGHDTAMSHPRRQTPRTAILRK